MAHKNKTLATLLAAVLGATGAHRWYLNGKRDRAGWIYLSGLALSLCLLPWFSGAMTFFALLPVMLSGAAACIEAMVIGLTPDERWDQRYNPTSGQRSDSGWQVVALVVLTVAYSAIGVIFMISRCIDLMLTGGNAG